MSRFGAGVGSPDHVAGDRAGALQKVNGALSLFQLRLPTTTRAGALSPNCFAKCRQMCKRGDGVLARLNCTADDEIVSCCEARIRPRQRMEDRRDWESGL
jgi:hypothetical protein